MYNVNIVADLRFPLEIKENIRNSMVLFVSGDNAAWKLRLRFKPEIEAGGLDSSLDIEIETGSLDLSLKAETQKTRFERVFENITKTIERINS